MNPTEEEHLRAQLHEATRANFALKTYIDQLNEQLKSQQEQVDVYRGQLLELSQSQSDVSEDAITKTFQSIFTGVELWIDELVGKPDFEEQFAGYFTKQLLEPRAERDLSDMTNNADVDWHRVGRSESCPYIILSLVIADRLDQDVFRLSYMSRYGHIYPPHLRKEQMRVLTEVQGKIRDQSLDNDVRASQWRSQAATALTLGTKDARNLRDYVLEDMKDSIEFWMGQSLSTEQLASLQAKVVDRALKAVHMIAGSSKEYVFLGSGNKPGQYDSNNSEWKARDIYSWGRPSRPLPGDGILKALYPGLSRRKDSRGPGGTLASPTLLVITAQSRASSPRKTGTKTPTSDSSGTRDSHSHPEHNRHPLPPVPSKDKVTNSKGLQGTEFFRFADSLVRSRHKWDIMKPTTAKGRDGKQRISKREDSSEGPKSAATFPGIHRHHKRSQTSSGTRHKHEDIGPIGRMQISQQTHPDEEYETPTYFSAHDFDGFDLDHVSRSPWYDRANWNVREGYGEPETTGVRYYRRYSCSA